MGLGDGGGMECDGCSSLKFSVIFEVLVLLRFDCTSLSSSSSELPAESSALAFTTLGSGGRLLADPTSVVAA